jgi:hypothetical protein
MKSASKYFKSAAIIGIIAAGIIVNDAFGFSEYTFIPQAEARVGRPLTPLSYAGVARRTTRRVIRRSTIYVNTLPASCIRVNVNNVAVWRCGGTYYQPYGGRYVVVHVN